MTVATHPRPVTTAANGFALVWRGAAARGAATVAAKGAALGVTLFLARTLPTAEAGSFFLALAAASTAGPLLSLGTAEMVARDVPTADAGGSLVEGASVVRSAIRVVGRLALVATLLAASVAFIVDTSFVAWAVVVAAMSSLLAIEAIGAAFLRARQRVVLAETLQAFAPTVFLAAVVVFARPSTDGQVLFGVRTGLELVVCLVLLVVIARMTREHSGGQGVRTLIHGAGPFWMCGLTWLALQNADVLILGASHGAAAVGRYIPILRVADLTATTLGLFAAYVLPIASRIHATGRTDEIRHVYVRATALTVALSIPVLSVLALAPGDLIGVLVHDAGRDAVTVARILAIAYMVNAMCGLSVAVLQALGDVGMLARRWSVVLATTIAADALLVPALGMVGAALGTLLALVLLNGVSVTMLWKRHRISALSRLVWVPAVAAMVAAMGVALIVPQGRVRLVAIAAVSTGAAGAAIWRLLQGDAR